MKDIETFEKAIDGLEKELIGIHNRLKEAWTGNTFNCGNFRIANDLSDIRFYHKDDRDVNFNMYHNWTDKEKSDFPYSAVDHFSWSSWSYSRMKPEEMEEKLSASLDYLSRVTEMIQILKDGSYLPVAKEFYAWYTKAVHPIKEEYYKIDHAIDSLKQKIQEQKKQEQSIQATEWFKSNMGQTFYIHNGVQYNRRNSFFNFTIKGQKKEKIGVEFDGMTKWLDSEAQKSIYNSIMRKAKTTNIDYDKDYGDPTRTTYILFDNMTNSQYEKINLTEVTKEEYYKA